VNSSNAAGFASVKKMVLVKQPAMPGDFSELPSTGLIAAPDGNQGNPCERRTLSSIGLLGKNEHIRVQLLRSSSELQAHNHLVSGKPQRVHP